MTIYKSMSQSCQSWKCDNIYMPASLSAMLICSIAESARQLIILQRNLISKCPKTLRVQDGNAQRFSYTIYGPNATAGGETLRRSPRATWRQYFAYKCALLVRNSIRFRQNTAKLSRCAVSIGARGFFKSTCVTRTSRPICKAYDDRQR
jgi:hypothetical protein